MNIKITKRLVAIVCLLMLLIAAAGMYQGVLLLEKALKKHLGGFA